MKHLPHVMRDRFTLFLFYTAVALLASHGSLGYDWFWDDAHLVRAFSPDELQHALTGNWDPDNIETPGYRPLTVLFDHVRATVFGESVVAHRVFMLALFAVYATLLARAGMHLGMGYWQVALAGVIIICAKNNWWNLVWITDGARVFGAVLSAIALLLGLRYAATSRIPALLLALLFATLALFTREEFLAVYPLLVLVIVAAGVIRSDPCTIRDALAPALAALRQALPVAALLLLIAIVFLGMRASLVPEATARTPQRFGGFIHLIWSAYPMGWLPSSDTLALQAIWTLMGASLLVLAALYLSWRARMRASLWILCAAVACAPGFLVWRPNLLLLPLSFVAYAVADIAGEVGRRSRPLAAWSAIIVLFLIVTSAARSIAAQESMGPDSSARLWADAQLVNSPVPLAIPEARYERMRERVSAAGITWYDEKVLDADYPALWKRQFTWGIVSWESPPRDLASILWGSSTAVDEGGPSDLEGTVRPRIGFLDP